VESYLSLYVNATANQVAKAGKTYSCAPYFGGNFRAGGPDAGRDPRSWGPANVSRFWRRVFAAVPAMRRVWVQDSIGVSTDTLPQYTRFMQPKEVAPFYLSLQRVAQEAGRELWSDTEIFQRHPTAAANISRVAEQLRVESAFVTGSVAFSWEYLSPVLAGRSPGQLVGSGRLFASYRRYLKGRLTAGGWKM